MDNLHIQEHSKTHEQQVIDLILHIQQNEYNIPITIEDQPDLRSVDTFYQKDKGNFWVCVYEEKVVGTIALIDIGNNQLALRKMFVAENCRGKAFGVSSSLLQTALDWAKTHGTKEIYLGTLSRFTAALKFYEKNGFVEILKSDLPSTFPIVHVDNVFYVKKI